MSINKKASVLFLICFALFMALSIVLLPAIAKTEEQQYLFNSLFVSIPAFFIPTFIFRRKHRFPKLRAPRFTHVLLAAVAGIGCIFLNEALYFLNETVFFGIEIKSASTSAASIMGMNTFLMVISLALIPPVTEEYLMRGTLLEIWRRTSPIGAALLTALLFALLHAAPSAFIIYFGMGILFAFVYLITRNMFLTMIIHLINNLSSVVIAALQGNASAAAEGPAAEAAVQLEQLMSTRAGCFDLFFTYAIYAALFITPAIVLLHYSCKKRGLGKFAPEEPIGGELVGTTCEIVPEPVNKESLWRDPILWVTIGLLVILNVFSALRELGVLKLD